MQDGSTTYRVKIRLKGYPAQTATFEILTDARKWVQQTETAIREGRHFKTSEAKRHTLGEAIERYILDVIPTKPKNTINQVGVSPDTCWSGRLFGLLDEFSEIPLSSMGLPTCWKEDNVSSFLVS